MAGWVLRRPSAGEQIGAGPPVLAGPLVSLLQPHALPTMRPESRDQIQHSNALGRRARACCAYAARPPDGGETGVVRMQTSLPAWAR